MAAAMLDYEWFAIPAPSIKARVEVEALPGIINTCGIRIKKPASGRFFFLNPPIGSAPTRPFA